MFKPIHLSLFVSETVNSKISAGGCDLLVYHDGERVTNGDPNVIRGVRHLNGTIHHAFGYAYVLTGDREFLKMGDEMFGASFGDATDTLRNLATVGGKEYDMTFRSSGRYLAWRLSRP